jgi:hypothetical protein
MIGDDIILKKGMTFTLSHSLIFILGCNLSQRTESLSLFWKIDIYISSAHYSGILHLFNFVYKIV